MPESITVSRVIPARAERIFTAWLDADEHAKMTGAGATSGPDGSFTAGDGYIKGRTLESTPFSQIVQSWRTTEYPEGAPDSTLTVTLEEMGDEGTKVTLTQSGMPEGQSDQYADGWDKYYFEPMVKYFGSTGSRLKDVGQAIEDVVERTGEAVEHAFEEAKEGLGQTAEQAKRAVRSAQAGAKKAVKKVQKTAMARAKAVQKTMGKLLGKKAKPTAAKKAKPAPKKTAAKKAAPKKAAPQKKPAPKKKAAPAKKAKAARRR